MVLYAYWKCMTDATSILIITLFSFQYSVLNDAGLHLVAGHTDELSKWTSLIFNYISDIRITNVVCVCVTE